MDYSYKEFGSVVVLVIRPSLSSGFQVSGSFHENFKTVYNHNTFSKALSEFHRLSPYQFSSICPFNKRTQSNIQYINIYNIYNISIYMIVLNIEQLCSQSLPRGQIPHTKQGHCFRSYRRKKKSRRGLICWNTD